MRRAQTRRLHRARLGAVRRLLSDLRRRLVQPAMRGARMGAISARQAITRSTPRRRARVRPARPTSAVRRTLMTQAAATFTKARLGSTLTMTRSAPATPASCCCAPVWPGLARPAEAPQGTMGYSRVLRGTQGVLWGYSRIPRRSARRRSTRHMVTCARPLWLGSTAAVRACNGCGYSTDRRGTDWVLTTCTTLSVHWSTARGRGRP
jgi:hypothetical protein